MSTRYEWTSAAWTAAAYVEPGHRVDGEPVEDPKAEGVATVGALVLAYDEAFVIEGTIEDLHALLDRMRAALPPR